MGLPPQISFIERDWLSANHIVFHEQGADGRPAATMIDTGYGTTQAVTLQRLRAVIGEKPLQRIINTHIHSDHIGGNAALQNAYPQCQTIVPADETEALSAWDSPAQMLSYADQQCERFAWNAVIAPDETVMLGGEPWQSIATPGHDMGSLVFYSPRHRLLISADALWEHGAGFVLPQAVDSTSLAAQRATFKRLAELDVALVLPGHGPMFQDFAGALKRASDKLEAFAADDMKIVRSVVKGMFVYSMMWRGTLPLTALPAYVRQVGIHRDYNAQFFRMSDEAYADWLLQQALATGKLRLDGDLLRFHQ